MPDIKLAIEDGIAHIRFDRPTVYNALSPSLLQELIYLCTDIATNNACRVVVLEGVGEHFSSGADLPKFMQDLESDPQATADLGRRATDSLAALPQITIAAVQGYCVGGALVLAAACDIRLVADDSRFFIPELDAGIPLAWGGMGHLVRLVGESLAADLVLSCRHFGADDALQSGFASRIIAAADLRAETESLAQSIAHKAQIVLRTTKQQLNSIRNGTFDASNDAHAMLAALADPDARQASLDYVRNNIHKGDRSQR
jgi:enoyl-CoA hydratase/carnithine racemase